MATSLPPRSGPLGPVPADLVERVTQGALVIRKRSLEMVVRAQKGHPGGDLSSADILATLYLGGVLRLDPRHPEDPTRDRFVMSKGHASASFYVALSLAGFFSSDMLDTYMQPHSHLNGHPKRGAVPGVEASTGPLGHGLPVAVGMALGAKLEGAPWRTYVLTGDGELQEGSNWEAAMAAAQRRLDNLTVIVDHNGLQLGDRIEKVVDLEPLVAKWEAFGWSVREVDGHDPEALLRVFEEVPFDIGRPNCIIAHTHKGRGVSFMEDAVEWHHRVPTPEELERALSELEGRAR